VRAVLIVLWAVVSIVCPIYLIAVIARSDVVVVAMVAVMATIEVGSVVYDFHAIAECAEE
jgi:hypothetical protein